MEWTRNLKRYMIGEDVRAVKDRLVELGYLAKATHNMYGDDTYKAVKAFQAVSNLQQDGIVGILTYTALFEDPQPIPSDIPEWFSPAIRTELSLALANTSAKRREICQLALQYCVDRNTNPVVLRCFYIRGANLYDKDLSLHVMTQARLDAYFRRTAYEPYYDGGRKEMMLKQSKAKNYTIPGADCSGFIVGLWRKCGVVRHDFDASANTLYNSYCVPTKSPQPGDLAHKDGHIGIYVAPNLIVEDAGGAYGVQLTRPKDRSLLNFVDRKIHKLNKWQHAGDPKVY